VLIYAQTIFYPNMMKFRKLMNIFKIPTFVRKANVETLT